MLVLLLSPYWKSGGMVFQQIIVELADHIAIIAMERHCKYLSLRIVGNIKGNYYYITTNNKSQH